MHTFQPPLPRYDQTTSVQHLNWSTTDKQTTPLSSPFDTNSYQQTPSPPPFYLWALCFHEDEGVQRHHIHIAAALVLFVCLWCNAARSGTIAVAVAVLARRGPEARINALSLHAHIHTHVHIACHHTPVNPSTAHTRTLPCFSGSSVSSITHPVAVCSQQLLIRLKRLLIPKSVKV